MREVQLVDDGAIGGVATLSAGTAGRSGGSRSRARVVAVAATVVAGLLLAGMLDWSSRGTFDAPPGALASLDGPVSELWHADVDSWFGLTESAGLLIGIENLPTDELDVVALDARTGEIAWRAARRPRTGIDPAARCALPAPDGADGRRLVACVVIDGPSDTLVVLDALTGDLVTSGPVARATSVAAIGSDLVLSQVDDAGRLRIERTDARDLHTRWTFLDSTQPDGQPLTAKDSAVRVKDGLIVAGVVHTWVLSSDGDLLRSWTGHPAPSIRVLNGGTALASTLTTGRRTDSPSTTEVIDLAGEGSVHIDGTLVPVTADDGSLTHVLLARPSAGEELVAYDLPTGGVLWTCRCAIEGPVIISGGRIIGAGHDRLLSIDGRTGRTRWDTQVEQPVQTALFSDGRLVLVTHKESDDDHTRVIGAYNLDDGARQWRAALPADLQLVTEKGMLLGTKVGRVVRLE